MNRSICVVAALAAAIGGSHAIAQAPPPTGVDLDAAKPKTSASAITGNLIGGPAQSANQKTTAGAQGSTTQGAAGSAVKSPVGTKTGIGVLGAPAAGTSGKAAEKEDPASSTDVQVKIPLKK